MYSFLHPSIGMGIGHWWSLSSRLAKGIRKDFLGEENEDLVRYARQILKEEKIDFFVFGHRHLGMYLNLSEGAQILFLGDWIKEGSYGIWDGSGLKFKTP